MGVRGLLLPSTHQDVQLSEAIENGYHHHSDLNVVPLGTGRNLLLRVEKVPRPHTQGHRCDERSARCREDAGHLSSSQVEQQSCPGADKNREDENDGQPNRPVGGIVPRHEA